MYPHLPVLPCLAILGVLFPYICVSFGFIGPLIMVPGRKHTLMLYFIVGTFN